MYFHLFLHFVVDCWASLSWIRSTTWYLICLLLFIKVWIIDHMYYYLLFSLNQ
jgi:hypothetical protein